MQVRRITSLVFLILFQCTFYGKCTEIPILLVGTITDVNGNALGAVEIELEYNYECVGEVHKDKVILVSDARGQYLYELNQKALEYIYWYGEACLYDEIEFTIRVHAKGYKDYLAKYRYDAGKQWNLILKDNTKTKKETLSGKLVLTITLAPIHIEERGK